MLYQWADRGVTEVTSHRPLPEIKKKLSYKEYHISRYTAIANVSYCVHLYVCYIHTTYFAEHNSNLNKTFIIKRFIH